MKRASIKPDVRPAIYDFYQTGARAFAVRGPLIPGAWRHPRDKEEAGSVGGEILINTGAFGAMIDVEAADRLRLPIRGTKEIHGIHGSVLFPAIKRSLFFLLRIRTEETANSQKLLNA